MKVSIVRWIGLYRRQGRWQGHDALTREIAALDERPAEPLWRGRSLIVAERPFAATLGLGFAQQAAVRAWGRDAWSEPEEVDGLLIRRIRANARPVSLRSEARRRAWWQDWHSCHPDWHGEVVLRSGARPIAIVVATGPVPCGADLALVRERRASARRAAKLVSAETGLPIVEVRGTDWRV